MVEISTPGAIEAGRIGRLIYVETTFARKLEPRTVWPGAREVPGGGVWMESGPDALDVVETIAGPISRIQMTSERREQGLSVEDEVQVETEHQRGVLSRILCSWNRQTTEPIARCVGSQAEILVGWAQTVIRDGESEEVVGTGYDERAAFLAVLNRFFARRTKSDSEEDHGAQSVDWLRAAYRSLSSGKWQLA